MMKRRSKLTLKTEPSALTQDEAVQRLAAANTILLSIEQRLERRERILAGLPRFCWCPDGAMMINGQRVETIPPAQTQK